MTKKRNTVKRVLYVVGAFLFVCLIGLSMLGANRLRVPKKSITAKAEQGVINVNSGKIQLNGHYYSELFSFSIFSPNSAFSLYDFTFYIWDEDGSLGNRIALVCSHVVSSSSGSVLTLGCGFEDGQLIYYFGTQNIGLSFEFIEMISSLPDTVPRSFAPELTAYYLSPSSSSSSNVHIRIFPISTEPDFYISFRINYGFSINNVYLLTSSGAGSSSISNAPYYLNLPDNAADRVTMRFCTFNWLSQTAGYSQEQYDSYGAQQYRLGSDVGYNKGYEKGVQLNGSFFNLFSAVIDAPISAFSGLLNFEILGINMRSFVLALLTLCFVVTIVRFFV